MVDQSDESTTPSGSAVFTECCVVLEGLKSVLGLEFCFLDASNQDMLGVEKILEFLEGVLNAVDIKLEEIAGGCAVCG